MIQNVIGDVKGKGALIFDDEIASGGSIVEVVTALRNYGVEEITACCVHGILSGKAIHRIQDSPLKRLIVTDTVHIPPEQKIEKLEILSIAELFANAIKCTNKGQSISGLYFRY